MMNCETARPLLAALADGELTGDQARNIQAHAGACAACAGILADFRTIAASARAHEAGVPDLWPAVRAAVDADSAVALVAEIRTMRGEMATLRAEIADLRRALSDRTPSRSTPLDVPYVRRASASPFQLV